MVQSLQTLTLELWSCVSCLIEKWFSTYASTNIPNDREEDWSSAIKPSILTSIAYHCLQGISTGVGLSSCSVDGFISRYFVRTSRSELCFYIALVHCDCHSPLPMLLKRAVRQAARSNTRSKQNVFSLWVVCTSCAYIDTAMVGRPPICSKEPVFL